MGAQFAEEARFPCQSHWLYWKLLRYRVFRHMCQVKVASGACIWCFYQQLPSIFTNEDSRLRTVKLVQKPQNWVHDAWLYWNCWSSKVQMIRNGPWVCICWNACHDLWRVWCAFLKGEQDIGIFSKITCNCKSANICIYNYISSLMWDHTFWCETYQSSIHKCVVPR